MNIVNNSVIMKVSDGGFRKILTKGQENKKAPLCGACSSGWARTSDPLINSQML